MSVIAGFPEAQLVITPDFKPDQNPLTWILPWAETDRFVGMALGGPLQHPGDESQVASEIRWRPDGSSGDCPPSRVLVTVTFSHVTVPLSP